MARRVIEVINEHHQPRTESCQRVLTVLVQKQQFHVWTLHNEIGHLCVNSLILMTILRLDTEHLICPHMQVVHHSVSYVYLFMNTLKVTNVVQ